MLDPHILLASASPRRAELLTQIGVHFAQMAVDIDESHNPGESPTDYVSRMAVEKAQRGWARQTGSLPALGADTSVVCGEQIFGKPADKQDALNMLAQLSGATHQVLSAVAICKGDELAFRLSKTSVRFRSISTRECHSYWQTGEPRDKAGAYGIQGLGAVFVAGLEGSYSGVVGLPLEQTAELLGLFNIPVWQTLEP
ncbi:MAG: Maf family protein [Porticoccaceae bacterium]